MISHEVEFGGLRVASPDFTGTWNTVMSVRALTQWISALGDT